MNYNNTYAGKNRLYARRDEIPTLPVTFNQENFNFDPNLHSCYSARNPTNQPSMRFDTGISQNPFQGFENPLPSLLPPTHPQNTHFITY